MTKNNSEFRIKNDKLYSICKSCEKIERKKYYWANRDIQLNRTKDYWKSNPLSYWCNSTIQNHKKKYRVLFNRKELFNFVSNITQCRYCRCNMKYTGGKFSKQSATLDRIDNEPILTLKNIQVICAQCNRTKGERTHREFINYCKQVGEI